MSIVIVSSMLLFAGFLMRLNIFELMEQVAIVLLIIFELHHEFASFWGVRKINIMLPLLLIFLQHLFYLLYELFSFVTKERYARRLDYVKVHLVFEALLRTSLLRQFAKFGSEIFRILLKKFVPRSFGDARTLGLLNLLWIHGVYQSRIVQPGKFHF